jgi:Sec-independent protein translocase protein TatA
MESVYRLCFYGGLALAIIFLIVTIVLFIVLKIPKVIGDLTGRNAKKRIDELRHKKVTSSETSKKEQAKYYNQSSGKIKVKKASEPNSQPDAGEEVTTVLNSGADEEVTTVLNSGADEEVTTVLNSGADEEVTTVLSTDTDEEVTTVLSIDTDEEATDVLRADESEEETVVLRSVNVDDEEATAVLSSDMGVNRTTVIYNIVVTHTTETI